MPAKINATGNANVNSTSSKAPLDFVIISNIVQETSLIVKIGPDVTFHVQRAKQNFEV